MYMREWKGLMWRCDADWNKIWVVAAEIIEKQLNKYFNNCSYNDITSRERSLLYESKGKDHVPSTSQKPGLTRLYKKILFIVYVNNVHI